MLFNPQFKEQAVYTTETGGFAEIGIFLSKILRLTMEQSC